MLRHTQLPLSDHSTTMDDSSDMDPEREFFSTDLSGVPADQPEAARSSIIMDATEKLDDEVLDMLVRTIRATRKLPSKNISFVRVYSKSGTNFETRDTSYFVPDDVLSVAYLCTDTQIFYGAAWWHAKSGSSENFGRCAKKIHRHIAFGRLYRCPAVIDADIVQACRHWFDVVQFTPEAAMRSFKLAESDQFLVIQEHIQPNARRILCGPARNTSILEAMAQSVSTHLFCKKQCAAKSPTAPPPSPVVGNKRDPRGPLTPGRSTEKRVATPFVTVRGPLQTVCVDA